MDMEIKDVEEKDEEEETMDDLLSALEQEADPVRIVFLANKIAADCDNYALEPLVCKYRHDYPVATKVAIIKAIGCLSAPAPKEFLDSVLAEEDITEELIKETFVAYCNIFGGEIDINTIAFFHDNPEQRKIAKDVLDELFPTPY